MSYQKVEDIADGDIGDQLEFQNFPTVASTSAPQSHPDTVKPISTIPFWSTAVTLFNVDTSTVVERATKSMIPREGYIQFVVGEGKMDAYGPFWILTTLVFLLFITSALSSSIASYSTGHSYQYDFGKLSAAVGLIYSYGIALPSLLWMGGKWIRISELSLIEVIGLYGYAATPWLPIAVACIAPITILRWVLVAGGAALSGYFLALQLRPVVAASNHPSAKAIIPALLFLHGAMALALKIVFFSYKVAGVAVGEEPLI